MAAGVTVVADGGDKAFRLEGPVSLVRKLNATALGTGAFHFLNIPVLLAIEHATPANIASCDIGFGFYNSAAGGNPYKATGGGVTHYIGQVNHTSSAGTLTWRATAGVWEAPLYLTLVTNDVRATNTSFVTIARIGRWGVGFSAIGVGFVFNSARNTINHTLFGWNSTTVTTWPRTLAQMSRASFKRSASSMAASLGGNYAKDATTGGTRTYNPATYGEVDALAIYWPNATYPLYVKFPHVNRQILFSQYP